MVISIYSRSTWPGLLKVLKFQEILVVIAEVKKMKGKNILKYLARRCRNGKCNYYIII
jgi:hypothetical protein